MNITLIGTAYPYRGGLAAYNERLARQFTSEGNNVDIITFTLQYPGFLFPGKTQYIDGPAPDGLKISRQVNSVNPLSWLKTGRKIKKQNPDILIFKYWLPFMAPCFGTIARIVKSNRHTKVICIFDNVNPHEKRPGDKLPTKFFIDCIDGAIAMSQSVIHDLETFRNDIPIKLNPHPLFDNFGKAVEKSDALSKLGLDANISYLLFFGFIRAYKGLDLLIEAFSDDHFRHMKIKLLIAGEFYDDVRSYKEMVRKFKLEDEVIFFDRFINDNEVSLFFSIADLVVQPYKHATQSGVTQIAYHFEKPMLVTDVGGLREIVPDGLCGYVVKPDPKEITLAIADYFDNNKNEFFIEGIRREKEKYSWERMTSSIIEVYYKSSENDSKK
jgi:D-inositol-3-phosphate glycosyltransferase